MALTLGLGCEDDDDTIDEGVSTGGTGGSTSVTGGTTGTGGTYGTGGAGGVGGSTGGAGGTGGVAGTGGAGGSTGGTGGTTVTYLQVKSLFAAKCTPCHSAGGIGAASHTLVDSNADAMKTAVNPACGGATKGACSLIRVKDGSMPLGKGCSGNPATDASNPACLTQSEQDMLAAWIAGGLM